MDFFLDKPTENPAEKPTPKNPKPNPIAVPHSTNNEIFYQVLLIFLNI